MKIAEVSTWDVALSGDDVPKLQPPAEQFYPKAAPIHGWHLSTNLSAWIGTTAATLSPGADVLTDEGPFLGYIADYGIKDGGTARAYTTSKYQETSHGGIKCGGRVRIKTDASAINAANTWLDTSVKITYVKIRTVPLSAIMSDEMANGCV